MPGLRRGSNTMKKMHRRPGVNTLAYRPLVSDLNDYSGNDHNFSATAGTYSFSNNMCTLQRATISGFSLANYSGDFTLSMRTTSGSPNCGFAPIMSSTGYPSVQLYWNGTNVGFNIKYNSASDWVGVYNYQYSQTGAHLITGVKTSTQLTLYIDGQEYNHITTSSGQMVQDNNTRLGRNVNGSSGTITCGDVIIEIKGRTAKEVVDYFNISKYKYS